MNQVRNVENLAAKFNGLSAVEKALFMKIAVPVGKAAVKAIVKGGKKAVKAIRNKQKQQKKAVKPPDANAPYGYKLDGTPKKAPGRKAVTAVAATSQKKKGKGKRANFNPSRRGTIQA